MSHSSTRMRTLVRWSESSLSTTTPRPEKAEPSRCIELSFLHRHFGVGFALEIAGVDGFEARLLDAEILEPALHSDDFGSGLRPHVAVGLQAHLADARPLNRAYARNERKPLGEARTIGLDVDHITAAENLAAKIGHRAHQRDAATRKQRNTIAHALHALEQMRGQQHRNTFGFEAADDGQQFGGRVRIEPRCRLVENGDLRALHEDFGKPEALAHAAGEGADALVGGFGKADAPDRV